MSSIFEPIFSADVLSDAVIATLQKWMQTYIQEIEHQRGWTVGEIAPPRMYVTRYDFTTYPDENIPLVVVISPGLASTPAADGEGRYSGWWSLGIGVVAAANTEKNSDRLAKVYAAAIRKILLDKQGLDDSWEFNGVEYLDETFDDLADPEQERTMRAARIVMRVAVENISTRFSGPAYPVDPDPGQVGQQWPVVQLADVKVVQE